MHTHVHYIKGYLRDRLKRECECDCGHGCNGGNRSLRTPASSDPEKITMPEKSVVLVQSLLIQPNTAL